MVRLVKAAVAGVIAIGTLSPTMPAVARDPIINFPTLCFPPAILIGNSCVYIRK